ncbi:F0F1 ATP synthase subunit B [Elusimicrobiota bacterium]
MDILNLFGLESGLFIGQILNFLILFFILKFFLYKPIMAMLDERSQKIKQGLDDAENAKKALQEADLQKIGILKVAKTDADKILENTKNTAQNLKQKTIDDAKKQSVDIVSEAKKQALEEFEKTSKQIGKMSVDISQKIVSKVLSELFTDQEKSAILSKAIEKIEKTGYDKGTN